MASKKENETVEENTQSIAVPSQTVVGNANDIQSMVKGDFDFNSLSPDQKLEVIREIKRGELEIELISLPMVNSKDILGKNITIHDALYKAIPDGVDTMGQPRFKKCVNFVCELKDSPVEVDENLTLTTGEFFTVLKSSNTINDVYVERFNNLRGLVLMPIQNYSFVEDKRFGKMGNPAIVLRKNQAAQSA